MKPIFIVLSILLILLILLIMCLLYLYTPYTPYTPLKYISVVIDGRLGNQFFEVISSWAYAKKYNMKFELPSDYSKQNQNYYDNFFSSIKLETKSELHKFFRSFEEKKYGTYENISNIIPKSNKEGILIRSYLQNSNNFNDYRDEILNNFFNITSVKPSNNKFFIHIRLTDFKTSKNHIMDLSNYYRKAIAYLSSKVDLTKIVMHVVSDDIEGARKESYLSLIPTQSLVFIDNNKYDDIKTLELFKECCGGAIIGHSTFAWWGAYIINCPSKIVVCPNKFLNVDEDYSGFYLNYKVIEV